MVVGLMQCWWETVEVPNEPVCEAHTLTHASTEGIEGDVVCRGLRRGGRLPRRCI